MDVATVRAFLASLEERPPAGIERGRAVLEVLQRPDVRYLVAVFVGRGAREIARITSEVLAAAGAPTGTLGDSAALAGAPLDDALVARAGTLTAAAAYQLAATHAHLGELSRREAEVMLALTAFAEASQRVALLVDESIEPLDPVHAPVADLVVFGRLTAAEVDRAMEVVPDARPLVCAPQDAETGERVTAAAATRGTPLLLGGRDFDVSPRDGALDVRVGTEVYAALPVAPDGDPQLLATGIAAALGLGMLGIRMREDWVIAGARAAAAATMAS